MKDGEFEKIPCPLCGYDNEEAIYHVKNDRVVMCRGCSLVYLNPRLTASGYRAYYEKEYQISRHSIYEYDQAITRLESKKSYEKKLTYVNDVRPFVSKHARVLDIGCGWGTLLKVLHDHLGVEVRGIEVSCLAAEVAKKHYGIDTFAGTLDEYLAQCSKEQFDVIIMHHVLEHMLDPHQTITSIDQLLTPSGAFVIAVPNMATPDEPLDRFFRKEHCAYFTPYTLEQLLRRHHFKIIRFIPTPSEMRVVAVRNQAAYTKISTYDWAEKYNKETIQRVISRQDRKYRVLRNVKRVGEMIVPSNVLRRVKQPVIAFLKKTRIIEI